MKNKKTKKKLFLAAAILLLIFAAGAYATHGKGGIPYEEVSVEARDITTYLEFSGNIEASNISKVYPDTSAKVLDVLVSEGDEVKKGDVIALLDSGDTEYNISLKETSLKLSRLQNSYNIKDSTISLEHQNAQLANGENSAINAAQKTLLTAQQSYQEAADTYNTAKAEYDAETTDSIVSAKEALKTAELNYGLNMANLNQQKENNDKLGQETTNYNEQKAVYENALAQAKADLAKAKDNAKEQVDDYYEAFLKAETSLSDAEKDYETAMLTAQQGLETSQAALEKTQALANVESSELELAHLRESLKDYTVYAPIDGFVTDLNIKTGETVSGNTAIAEITDLTTMQAAIKIDEYDVGQVSVGDSVQIYINAFDKTYEGKIASISKKATIESDVSYLKAIVEFETDDAVSSGLSAEIKLIKADEKSTASLPVKTIEYESDNTAYVYTKAPDGSPAKTYVTLGVSDGTYVQILDGVKIGDTILTMPSMNNPMMSDPSMGEGMEGDPGEYE